MQKPYIRWVIKRGSNNKNNMPCFFRAFFKK